MRNTILVDIDHTLSNAFWRDPMIGTVSWDEYHQSSRQDAPLHDMIDIVEALSLNFNIVGFTARPAKWRKLTMEWCILHGVNLDELLMRPDDNYRPAPELKLELVNARFPNPKEEVAAILDDREDVIAAFKGIGITALQVHARQS